MEPNELDKLFKNQIDQDRSALNNEERQSKDLIWDRLETNKMPVINRGNKPISFWRITAAVLFMFTAASILFMNNKLEQINSKYVNLENDHLLIKEELQKKEIFLELVNQKLQNKVEKSSIVEDKIYEQKKQSQSKTQSRESIVFVRDTIYEVQVIKGQEIVNYIRDTVFIGENTAQFALPNEVISRPVIETDTIEEALTVEKERPRKVEFILGKKDLRKPKKGTKIKAAEVAKKEQHNN